MCLCHTCLCNRKGGGDPGKWVLNAMLFFSRWEETKQTVLQNRIPGWELVAKREELWKRSRMKSPQMARVLWRSPSHPPLRPPTPSPSLGSAAHPAATAQRTRRCSWSTSANTDEEARKAATSSVSSAARVSHPFPPWLATASLPTKCERPWLTTLSPSARSQHLLPALPGTTRRVSPKVPPQHLPHPKSKLTTSLCWRVRFVTNALIRHQIWIHTSELTVWPLSVQGTRVKHPEMSDTCKMGQAYKKRRKCLNYHDFASNE